MNLTEIQSNIKYEENKIRKLRLNIKFREDIIDGFMKLICDKVDIEANCRPMKAEDVIVGQIVVHDADEGFACHIINEVLKPNDPFKAYSASDGCRYGLDGAYLIVKNNEVKNENQR